MKRRAHDADLKEMVVIRSPSPQLVPFKLHRFGQQRLVQRVLYAIFSPEIDLQRVPLVTARLVYSYWQGSGDDDNHSAKEGANKYPMCQN